MAQFNPLSNREWDVVKLLLQGKSNKLIALSLGISERTVEFHLKNIYAKYQVSSRIELIMALWHATGGLEIEKLGYSTVVSRGESTENRDKLNPRTDWGTSFRETVSIIGKELEMKNLFTTKHVPVGMITALVTGFAWVSLLSHFGHMTLDAIKPWILLLVVLFAVIGLLVGVIAKHNGNSLRKVFFSTFFGTGLSAVASPFLVVVVIPLGKLAEMLGIIDRTTIPIDVASNLVIVAMILIWLAVGTAIGTLLLFLSLKKSRQTYIQTQPHEQGM